MKVMVLRRLGVSFCYHEAEHAGPSVNGRVLSIPLGPSASFSSADFNFRAPEVYSAGKRPSGSRRKLQDFSGQRFSAEPSKTAPNVAFRPSLRSVKPGVFKKDWMIPA